MLPLLAVGVARLLLLGAGPAAGGLLVVASMLRLLGILGMPGVPLLGADLVAGALLLAVVNLSLGGGCNARTSAMHSLYLKYVSHRACLLCMIL
jgi:hypothetical protein